MQPQPMYQAPAPAYVPPKKETAIPLLAGVFNILSAIAWFIAAFLGFFVFIGWVCLIPGVFSLIAAVFCFQRTNWAVALIMSLLGGNILALILVVISKEEFDWPQNAPPMYAAPAYPAYPPQYPQYAAPPAPAQPAQMTRICMGCGQTIPASYAVCPHCGRPQTAAPSSAAAPPAAAPATPPAGSRFCPSCGSPVAAGQTFCARCGTRVA